MDDTSTPLDLNAFIASSSLPIIQFNKSGTIREANHAFHALTQQYLLDSSSCNMFDVLTAASKDEFRIALDNLFTESGTINALSLELNLPNGNTLTIAMYANRIEAHDDAIVFAHLIDTTEQKNLEMRFAHSQKMQAVGQLAGGVAHDFNNLLTAMIGFCDLLLLRHPAGDQSFADIMQIKQNANRAANLVRQLLAFSRRQTLQPKTLEITDVLAELANLVRRLIGENIELKMVHGRDVGAIKADQGQLEQVIINLAVNARDAMNEGGILTIQTSMASIPANYQPAKELIAPLEEDSQMPEGQYVLVEVIDTGTGIPHHLVQKIFEPFFSTKEIGSGTGLGLSTVYGIIKQTGGFVFVESREGVGTRFKIYFPAQQSTAEKAPADEQVERHTPDLTGQCTILLVEDETPVRLVASRALRNKGYNVLEADCAERGLELIEEHNGQFDLIITDVIMPGMNGPNMVDKIHEQHPNIQVIFMSGYAEDIFVDNYGHERSFNFLAKPFTLKKLASKVKEVTQGQED